MTVVLVHGVPETAAVWDPLVDELAALGESDVLRLSPPGFGAPVPDGFAATMEGYRDWLVAELGSVGGPVDLVGHDWGGGHVLNAVMARPELVRTWVSDVPGVFDAEYVWHDLAQAWQTPEVGETAVSDFTSMSDAGRVDFLVDGGMSADVATRVSPGIDDAMGRSILTLYRSAAQPAAATAGANLEAAAARPGLALLPAEDHFVGTDGQRRRAAERAGARVEVLPGLGHWWMTQDPAVAARLLVDFWSSHR
ncbi:alpha/beta hydrolase [Mycolicibacterium sp. P1-18]|uniref:alpha/beta fold hydrolase n=1 Tax=Mycolicibacterium sp. P1-18 TaxID=2024615 RepID=UPI0011F1432B|nr:alpha/beta hydrolase [Mycolicibacterium sp. P1-18]KAA0101120.1 alpha/beta hydrolase [Mycolicibacterium sp. P1-18]